MEEGQVVEIKIIRNGYDSLMGVQRTFLKEFHDGYERYKYLGNAIEGEIVSAKLIYQARYPGGQWSAMPDWMASTTERETRRVYVDA